MSNNEVVESHEFFIEVGVEEMPASLIATALRDFQENGQKQFAAVFLSHAPLRGYATPRRLILHTPGLASRQNKRIETLIGPPAKISFTHQGAPTQAAIGFAKSAGVPPSKLKVLKTEKGEYLSIEKTIPSRPTFSLLQEIVPEMIASLRFPKAMRWNSATSFIRPVRWLVVLYNRKVVPCAFSGVSSGNVSYGHRLLAPQPFRVTDFATFKKELRKRFVLMDPEERYGKIKKEVHHLADNVGGKVEENEDLLWNAVFSTEYPVALCGTFDPPFLALPEEIRSTVMKEHQGYLPLRDATKSLPYFIAIANTHHPKKKVQIGNERVLRARFNDAQFYFEEDRKGNLADRLSSLKGISFHEGLGTLYDKTERLTALARFIAEKTACVEAGDAVQAARLCKCDLTTGIVREFPSLQGVMGRILTENPKIGKAIEDQYRPRYSGDGPPVTPLGRVLALADKLDTVIGCFGMRRIPTGSEDPYALRRQGFGIVQILGHPSFESLLILDLTREAVMGYRRVSEIVFPEETVEAVTDFLKQRMGVFLQSFKIRYDLIDAVLEKAKDLSYAKTVKLAHALSDFSIQPLFNPLLTCYKRVARILRDPVSGTFAPQKLTSGASTLYEATRQMDGSFGAYYGDGAFEDALKALATLYSPLNRFFTEVLVMDPDETVRNNNLLLLQDIKNYFLRFGDFSKIQEGEKTHE